MRSCVGGYACVLVRARAAGVSAITYTYVYGYVCVVACVWRAWRVDYRLTVVVPNLRYRLIGLMCIKPNQL